MTRRQLFGTVAAAAVVPAVEFPEMGQFPDLSAEWDGLKVNSFAIYRPDGSIDLAELDKQYRTSVFSKFNGFIVHPSNVPGPSGCIRFEEPMRYAQSSEAES